MIALSPLDQERFGIVTARSHDVTAANLPEGLRYCEEHRVELLIARCDAADLSAVHALEAKGALLMDTLVYWSRSLEGEPVASPGAASGIRPATTGDAAAVRDVAARAFRGYLGHYHMDPRLDRASADEAYADWAYRSCTSRAVADEVLVAVEGEDVKGFLTVRQNGPDEAEIVLNGVVPDAQGSGVYGRLLATALLRARSRGARRMLVSTQLANYRVQHAWARAGFHLASASYTFHLWRTPR